MPTRPGRALAGAALLCAAPALARAQGAPATPRVTLSLRDLAPAEALGRLTAASGMSLVADAGLLETSAARGRRVFCQGEDVPAEEVLRCIVRDAGLDFYRLSSGTYVVIARAEQPALAGAIAGVVVDGATGEPIPQARLTIAERGETRAASGGGVVSFGALPPGRYRLVATALGYEPLATEVELAPSGALRERLALRRRPLVIAPVVVNGIVPQPAARRVGAASVDGDALARAAALGGGPSLLLQGAPGLMGVAQRAAFGDLHIQGGESGEHQLRLDGMPIFDPVSLGRLQGAMSPLAIERLTVHKAGFGAGVGSFTAGVIDMEQSLGEADAPGATLQVDAASANARLTMPARVGGARVAAMVAARTSLWELWQPPATRRALERWNGVDPVLAQRLAGTTVPPGTAPGASALAFTDVHAAVRAQLGAFRSVRASGYLGRSRVGTDVVASAEGAAPLTMRDDYAWRTMAAQLRHDWLLGARAAHSVRLRAGRHTLDHRYGMGGEAAAEVPHDGNRVDELALESTLDASLGARWQLATGVELARTASAVDMTNPLMPAVTARATRSRAAAHAQLARRVGERVHVEAGARVTALAGEGRAYAEPRVAVRADGEGDRLGAWAWRVAAGEYRQFVSQLDVAALGPSAIVPSVRFWLPTDAGTGVPRAQHLAAEGVVSPWPGWSVRAEAYAKRLPTLLAFDYAALMEAGGETAFAGRARGEAYGAGVRVARAGAALRIEGGYDWGTSRRTFPSRFGGARQPVPWNEPHRALLALDATPAAAGWRLPAGLQASLRVRGVWGRTWALRQAYYDLLSVHSAGAGLPIDAPGESTRPPVYEADVGASWGRALAGGGRVEVGASVLNVLDRRNVLDYALVARESGGWARVPRTLVGAQPTVFVRIGR